MTSKIKYQKNKTTTKNPNIAKNDGKHNYFVNREGYIVQSCYQRILIKRRKKDENST